MTRIVLDTAAVVTAVRSANGAAGEVVELILRGVVVILMDHKVAYEYRDVALRPEHVAASALSHEEIATLIDALEDIAEPVLVDWKHRPLSIDPDDDMILDVAIEARADALVTDNKRHFKAAGQRFGIPVLSPAEFLKQLREEDKDGE